MPNVAGRFFGGVSVTFWLVSRYVTMVISDRVYCADLRPKRLEILPISRCFAGQTYRGASGGLLVYQSHKMELFRL